ncbi:MAG: hypothetical protein IPM61_09075 [Chlorobi bacterium]|nr:MAG: hypothetical protein UZ07_CHB004001663 [Chlorobi bacterium OLB7]MBK8911464.1 hypothetical protein [Chlorobiota bacterium]MBX7215835.1 hypothetical protein [Candidatus Kapabacteria bacterium]MCE7936030.1 hypothetical protein [Chlorobi bacterium CHB2]
MPKVILLVNVELKPGKRESYLAATSRLREHFKTVDSLTYTVYENESRDSDSFTETFTFPSYVEYEAFDDRDDDAANELFAEIISMGKQSPRYTTLVEVE